jgi:hypothetical protein
MSTAPQDGGGFDDLPPLDDEWVSKAAKREETADQRAARLRRIAAEHERLQRQQESERRTAVASTKRDRLRPWIIGGAIMAALVLVFMII